jgi:hypothetical protein
MGQDGASRNGQVAVGKSKDGRAKGMQGRFRTGNNTLLEHIHRAEQTYGAAVLPRNGAADAAVLCNEKGECRRSVGERTQEDSLHMLEVRGSSWLAAVMCNLHCSSTDAFFEKPQIQCVWFWWALTVEVVPHAISSDKVLQEKPGTV